MLVVLTKRYSSNNSRRTRLVERYPANNIQRYSSNDTQLTLNAKLRFGIIRCWRDARLFEQEPYSQTSYSNKPIELKRILIRIRAIVLEQVLEQRCRLNVGDWIIEHQDACFRTFCLAVLVATSRDSSLKSLRWRFSIFFVKKNLQTASDFFFLIGLQ